MRFVCWWFAFTLHSSYHCSPHLVAKDRQAKIWGEEISQGRSGDLIHPHCSCAQSYRSLLAGGRRQRLRINTALSLWWLWLRPQERGRQQFENKLTSGLSAFLTRASGAKSSWVEGSSLPTATCYWTAAPRLHHRGSLLSSWCVDKHSCRRTPGASVLWWGQGGGRRAQSQT